MKLLAPMLTPLLCLVLGIIAAKCGAPLLLAAISAILGFGFYFYLTVAGRSPLKAYKINRWHNLWIVLILFSIGQLVWVINSPSPIKNIEDIIAIEGHLEEKHSLTSGDRALISMDKVIYHDGTIAKVSNVKMLLSSEILDAVPDDKIIAKCRLDEVGSTTYFFKNKSEDIFRNRRILYQVKTEPDNIQIIGHEKTLRGTALKIKTFLESKIEQTHISKPVQNFLITILLGDRDYLNQALRAKFADGGISHILALSGMHVALIGGIILWILFPFNMIGRYRLRLILTSIILIIYAFITGWNPSTVRATLMMLAFTISILLERKNTAWNSLLLATFIIILFNPYAIFDIGLQLSFVCVTCLIFFVNSLNPFDQHLHPQLFNLSSIILASLVATIGTWCLSAYYFVTVPLMFLPLNIFVLPFLPLYLTVGIIYFTLALIGLEWDFIRYILELGYDGLINLVNIVTGGGNSALHFTPSITAVILWFAIILLAAIMIHRPLKKIQMWCAPLLVILMVGVIAIPGEAESQSGILVNNGWRNINVMIKKNQNLKLYELRRFGSSKIEFDGHKMLVLDCGVEKLDSSFYGKYDEVVIAGGCKDKLSTIVKMLQPDKIIVHQSMRSMPENEIIKEADSLKYSCHSIRQSGPYVWEK